jgi:hypothetical protein
MYLPHMKNWEKLATYNYQMSEFSFNTLEYNNLVFIDFMTSTL